MGLGDIIWPFQKKFSEILCAREAGIVALLGGPGLGAVSIILAGNGRYAFKTSIYSGFALFWLSFTYCRFHHNKTQKMSEKFLDAYKSGDID